MQHDIISARRGFRLYPQLITSLKNQQTSFGTRVLNRCAHEPVDQFFQSDLARDCLRDFDNGSEIQEFDRCHDCARRSGGPLFLFEVRIQLVELPYFAIRAPTQIAIPGFKQVGIRDLVETSCRVKTCGELVGDRLVVNKSVCVRRVDSLFVKLLGIESAAFDAGDLGTDERCMALEVRRAVLGPLLELPMMSRQCLLVLGAFRNGCRIAKRSPHQRGVDMVLCDLQ